MNPFGSSDKIAGDKKVLVARSYQLEMLDYVTKFNGIIYLPTGSGKTFIAMLALKRFSHEMEKPVIEGGKRAIFMCNTVELARQQANEIKKTLNLKVGLYVGERNVDDWSRRVWKTQIEENQVLVGTAQIFVDIVRKKFIRLSDVSIVILDECHHATGAHPMHQFLTFIRTAYPWNLPRVVGLTGVLIVSNRLTRIGRDLSALEAAFCGKIITVSNMEEYHNAMVYSTKPIEKLVTYTDVPDEYDMGTVVKKMINEICSMVENWNLGRRPKKLTKGLAMCKEHSKKLFVINLLKDFLYQMQQFGIYGGSVAILLVIKILEIREFQSDMSLRNMYHSTIANCIHIRDLLTGKINEMLVEPNDDCDVILHFSSPKMHCLLWFIKSTFANKNPNDISCLIFVERRYSARCVCYVLKKYIDSTPEIAHILRPSFMVGRNTVAPGILNVLDRKRNKDVLAQFRAKEYNLIVCSSVLEEGIDLQACNYVFVLDSLRTFRSYIQTKGRARKSDSMYAIFALKTDAIEIAHRVSVYQRIHNTIKDFMIGRTLNYDDPSDNKFSEQVVQVLKTYDVPNGATLNGESALHALNRYCQSLPADGFGTYTPWFAKKKVQDKIIVTIKLPLQSLLIETIVGDPMESIKLAKMSAALKACIMLHQLGELNDDLVPKTADECIAAVKEDLLENWKKYPDEVNSKSVGSKTYRRLYERLCPNELYEALPVVGQPCFAYEIVVTPDFKVDKDNEHLDTLMRSCSNYAFLLGKRLPALAEMPLFTTHGQVRAKIVSKPEVFVLNSTKELEQLRMYHIMIFRDLLQCWRDFFVIDERNKQNSYLLAPLRGGAIDWDLVRQFQRLPPQRQYSEAELRKKQYKPEDYMGSVLHSWYSVNTSELYVVTNVLTDSNPYSPYHNCKFASYAEYMEKKYRQQIVNKQQFLVEVVPLNLRQNCFINGRTKVPILSTRTVLIPEMCYNFMYPGGMWLKAFFLPSILHRVYFLLHAENLRVRINDFLGLTPKFETAGPYQPKPLVIDKNLTGVVYTGIIDEPQLKEVQKLPTVPKTEDCEISSLTISNNEIILDSKDCMEPQNFQGRIKSLYPVEIDYYSKFLTALEETNASNLDDEEEYSNSQLKVAKPKSEQPSSEPHDQPIDTADVRLAEKRHIKILDRNSNLCSAEQSEFLMALTTTGANDVFNMERFEVLGDSFLKFSMSLYLMHKYPRWHEGFLTQVKSHLISNRNLLYCMLEFDIPQRICGNCYVANSAWIPPLVSIPSNILDIVKVEGPEAMHITPRDLYALQLSEEERMSGKCSKENLIRFIRSCKKHRAVELSMPGNDLLNIIYKQTFQDKVVADTLEAILGVCVKNYGIQESFRMLNFFGICRNIDGKSLTQLLDLELGSPLLRPNVTEQEVDGFLINYKQLEENLGYQFRDRAYLLQALTHPSFPTNRITGCYQQLEFIGDAILDFLISCYMYERCETMKPGQLTDLRSALVNNITLGCVCVRHRFHLFLLSENELLSQSIKRFAAFQEKQDHRVTDQVLILMEENDSEAGSINMAVNIVVPKALGDIVEALIAAVYMDCRDLIKTWAVIYGLLEQEINQFMRCIPIDPVRQLYEYKGANPKFAIPLIDRQVMVKCSFTCRNVQREVNGFGPNTVNARKSAAKHALQILNRK